ncbi:MAG: phosphoribosylformylglycinamidine synthase subunit PurQ [Deltaproteobacteria bacterium]|nr:phosphoribosylformylglycinamidine synthase subunit PurQ [Deltaproteobacteria bacterium]
MKRARTAVVIFPGSNCDHDVWHVWQRVLGRPVEYVFHTSTSLAGFDAVVLPGGFSYGDYLRSGAIARFSPIMQSVVAFAKAGGPVLGICNGFQVLTEAGLLAGALTRNRTLRFECRDVHIVAEAGGSMSEHSPPGTVLRMPIAHADGRFVADAQTLRRLEGEGLVAFRYCEERGAVTDAANPNGSANGIAGIYNDARNVLGLMPHPERASEEVLGCTDGLAILRGLADLAAKRAA